MRSRVITALAVMAILLGGILLIPAAYRQVTGTADGTDPGTGGQAAAEPVAPPPPTLATAPVTVPKVDGFFGWALLDRGTGTISGSPNMTATNSTESMIKIWLAADYLRQLDDKPLSATFRKHVELAIRDSNDDSANALYRAAGGAASLDRMIETCELTETRKVVPPGSSTVWWSYTRMSPRDAVRLGECVASGTAAGPKYTELLLGEMSKVRGSVNKQQLKSGGGRWGIIDGLPKAITTQGPVGIKNGWTMIYADNKWHVNCLAVNEEWVLAVMLRYPNRSGLKFGAQVCASVATQLVTPQPGAALKVPVPLGTKSDGGDL